jgi:signal transduction histidine kinase
MTSSVSEKLNRVERGSAALAAAFELPENADLRAARLARVVRSLWPTAPLSACILSEGGLVTARVLDANGRGRPDLGEQLLATWQGASPQGEVTLVGYRVLLEPAALGERVFGALGVSPSGNDGSTPEEEVRAVLRVYSRQLALHLALAEQTRELSALRQQLAEEQTLAVIGELAGPVIHEFNNLLNTMLLQVAVMEQKVDASLLPDLQTIRRQGATITALVKQWQECRRRPPNVEQAVVEVNPVIQEVVKSVCRQRNVAETRVTLSLPSDLPILLGPAVDFRRLVAFLLSNALSASGAGGVRVSSECAGEAVVLRVEDTGPAIPAAALPRMFEPLGQSRPGTNRLELAACRTLVRRQQGKLRGENRPDGGVAVVVELPFAQA